MNTQNWTREGGRGDGFFLWAFNNYTGNVFLLMVGSLSGPIVSGIMRVDRETGYTPIVPSP